MAETKFKLNKKWRHPALKRKNELTLGERSADLIRNGMGSWVFVFVALIFLLIWMIGNRNVGFDPFPFILLNLVLSCLAAMQGAILLIAAKREDQISSALAKHDYEINKRTEKLVIALHQHILKSTPDALDEINKEIAAIGSEEVI
jgi:uncharacterized membrane protein